MRTLRFVAKYAFPASQQRAGARRAGLTRLESYRRHGASHERVAEPGGGLGLTPPVDGSASEDGAEDLCVEDLERGGGEEVAVEDDEIGEEAGFEAAEAGFAERGEGRRLGVGVDGFLDGQALLGVEGLGAGFVLAGDGGVEAAEGVDGLDGVVGAEGEGDAVREHGTPGVGVFGAFGAEAGFGPGHVGEEVGGLHGGDDAELGHAVEVFGQEDLGVLDAEAWGGGPHLRR